MEEMHGVMSTTKPKQKKTTHGTGIGSKCYNNNNDDNDDSNNVNENNNGSNAGSCGNNNNDPTKKKIEEEEEGENALLQQMEYEIEKIVTANFATATAALGSSTCIIGTAYQKAKLHQSEYIHDRNFRYAFLNKEEMDPKKTALRFLRYLDFIVQLYHTEEVLFRPIMLQDLSEKSRQVMYKEGPLQILPIRDPSGRKIFVHLRDFGPYYDMKTKQQVGVYLQQCLSLEDRDGVILVYFLHQSNHKIPDLTELRMTNALLKVCPVKFSAFHLCCPNIPLYDVVKAAVILHFGKEMRLRLRLHVGSYTECKYSLKSFGIAVDRLPLNLELWKWSHNVDIKYFRKWLKMRHAKENAIILRTATILNNNIDGRGGGGGGGGGGVMSAVHRIRSIFTETPHQEDCLFGKGSSAMSHPGNVAMRRLIEERYERYEELTAATSTKIPVKITTKDNNSSTTNSTINHKEQLATEIISEIKRGMGKFLKEDDEYHGLFIEVDDTVARKKIGIAFRDLKKRKLPTSTVNLLASSNAHSDSCAATAASIFDVSLAKLHQRRKLCHPCFGDGDGTPKTS
ncbi:hypothetical protein FRACYDRAFT_244415 [Fragilariopsis cylindrus CCMP1102]|uniref:DUF6824 domain-containing protein n=1 Tax=Fragilariopsis cylindrus CCMP1102 TaxID=635003 RepID=A0A1E7F220_9STRA|nr:hypothetical protein FRACYDRAFT_244415 [Fragilariopsis cylindrus CCMP1102]|eukprot:OEU12154.1 hypothetical protein FRACYDRAFT_244415 [Fragilariopsis cylindrus CCMP1102]